MKNLIPQLSIAVIAFVALTLLMSYTRPATDEPKQYILVQGDLGMNDAKCKESLEKLVNQKLSEGWHCQGGAILAHGYIQPMVK